jgi:hypothetical protein
MENALVLVGKRKYVLSERVVQALDMDYKVLAESMID